MATLGKLDAPWPHFGDGGELAGDDVTRAKITRHRDLDGTLYARLAKGVTDTIETKIGVVPVAIFVVL